VAAETPSLDELKATVARMEAGALQHRDPSQVEPWRLYQELAARFEADLGASSRDALLAKSAALMLLQALAQARSRASVLVNIDVADLARATTFYCQVFDLTLGRRFGEAGVELIGAGAPIYLLAKHAGSRATPTTSDERHYRRHWTPVHLDFVVTDIGTAVERARAAGALLEVPIASHSWGRIALMADPFGHGFCLIQFVGRGYDEIDSA
jgi:predicted enzyme related to lactoylglutathione lyase